MQGIAALAFMLFAMSPMGTESSSCQQDIHVCLAFITPFKSNATLTFYDRDQLDKFCAVMPRYNECLDVVLPSCSEIVRLSMEGGRDVNNMLCHPNGSELMVRHAECFKQERTQNAAIRCQSANDNSNATCSAMIGYLNCTISDISNLCGDEAGDFLFDANVMVLQPLYKHIGCHGNLGSFRLKPPPTTSRVKTSPTTSGGKKHVASFGFVLLVFRFLFL